VLRLLETHPRLLAVVQEARGQGVRFTFLVRLLPVNQALLSYALGAARGPLRSALAGNLGMFTHMLPTVYFGAAAVHMTRMAGTGQPHVNPLTYLVDTLRALMVEGSHSTFALPVDIGVQLAALLVLVLIVGRLDPTVAR
jgi:hypothetical protein